MLWNKARPLLACIAALAVAVSLPLTGCRKDTPEGKSFRFPLDAEPRQLDPQVSSDSSSVALVSALFEGLTRLDENGAAVPAAATWTVSADGLTYTFTLRESYWSTLPQTQGTGDPLPWEKPVLVTAHDFVFGMQRAVLPLTGSNLASQLFGILNAKEINEGKKKPADLGVKATSDDALVITLTEPDPGFPERLAGTPFMPCHSAFFEHTAGRYGLEKAYVLSNGPFALDVWNHGASLLLRKNEGYHAAAEIAPAAVRYVIMDKAEAGAALLDGSMDAAEIAPSQLDAAREAGLHLETMSDTIEYVWFNNGVTCLSSAPIRRALRDALAWDLIAEQLDDTYCKPAQGYIAPDALLSGTEPYRNAGNIRSLSTNAQKARQQMAAGLAALNLEAMPTLKVLCAQDTYSTNLARYIIQSWQSNLSLYFQLEPVSADELRTRILVGNYQIAVGAQTGASLYAMDGLSTFLSDAPSGNYARYSSAAYDKLYKELSVGNASRGDVDRLEKLLVEECPSVPLSFQQRFFGVLPQSSGIVIRPFGGGAYGSQFSFRQAGKLD